LRIVGDRGADPDQYRIDQRAQPMQVGKPRRTVDVMRIPAGRGDAGVDRLAELPDDHHFVGGAPQGPENLAPGRGQGALAPERRRYAAPGGIEIIDTSKPR
jgi:hypothetical protein